MSENRLSVRSADNSSCVPSKIDWKMLKPFDVGQRSVAHNESGDDGFELVKERAAKNGFTDPATNDLYLIREFF